MNECDLREPGDTAWLLSSAVLVLTMQGGFALLESGSVRVNNSVNILVKNVFDMTLGGMAYWAFGWGLAYGKSLGGFIGTSDFFPDAGLDYSGFVFQLSFAATASTIDSGACAEKMKLWVYFGLSFFVSGFVYPIVTHWVWSSDGFLYKMGYVDLAGVSCVHVLGGASALSCSVILGPRLGLLGYEIPKELKCVEKQLRLSHHVFRGEPVHLLFGSLLLFFGWIGFNSGSSLAVSAGGHLVAGHVAFTTIIGACFGSAAGSLVGCLAHHRHHLNPGDIATALLSGLVAVTGSAHVLTGAGAALIGSVAAIVAVLSTKLLEKFNIDDPVGVLPVHLVAGFFGSIAPGLLATDVTCSGNGEVEEGLFYGGSPRLLGVQVLGFTCICAWGFMWTTIYLLFIRKVLRIEIRVDPIHEMVGNDVTEHGVDIFKKLKHTHAMQRLMAKISRDNSLNITKTSMGPDSRVGSRVGSSKVSPGNGVPRRESRTVKALGISNYEALSFAAANLDHLSNEQDAEIEDEELVEEKGRRKSLLQKQCSSASINPTNSKRVAFD